jgi:hypothetical protein
MYDAESFLKKATEPLITLVAKTTIWANPEVYKRLVKDGGIGVWYPNVRRFKKGEKKGRTNNGDRLDDNTYANFAIKKALVGTDRKQISGFSVCHIWPKTCYDDRYHTNIANLVLMPQSIASLSDFHPDVRLALQFHSYGLYRWYPDSEKRPTKPKFYPSKWLEPGETEGDVPRKQKGTGNRRGRS